MKKVVLVMSLFVFGICTHVIAQDKVVVIPLNSNKAAGNDKQFQYNNNGTLAGSEVYYDNTNGIVGIGTMSPELGHRLHVNGLSRFDLNGGRLYISTPGGNPGLIAFDPINGHRRDITFDVEGISLNVSSDGLAPSQDNGISITENGNVGIGTITPAGKLDVNGSIFQRGGSLHADYVFDPKYKLESIEEHTAYMWEEKHLKAVPKAQVDENGLEILEMGAHRKGMLEELEKAHIYIGQLNEQIASLKSLVCRDHPEAKECK